MLCSNIETGIGCTASSIPSLRHFFRREYSENSSDPTNKRSIPRPNNNHFTIGSQSRRGPIDSGFSLASVNHGRAEETWERLHDGASDQSEEPIAPRTLKKGRISAFDFELRDLPIDDVARIR